MECLKDKGPDYLIQLSRSYWLSQALFVARSVGIFELLAGGSKDTKEIASHLQLDSHATPIFLTALTSMGLLTTTDGQQYNNSPLSNQYLVKDRPGYMGDFVSHTEYMKNYWEGLAQTLKTGQPPIAHTNTGPNKSQVTFFLDAMEQATTLIAPDIIDALDLRGRNRLLDLGSGLAPISRLLLEKYPHLHITLFDLSHVIKEVKEKISFSPLYQSKVFYREGDCRHEDYGNCIYDVVLISNLIHMYDLETNNKIFTQSYKALREEGWLIIHDYVLADGDTAHWQGALFALNMLVGTCGGKNYSWEEIQTSLANIGFFGLRLKQLKAGTSLVIAVK